jgi:uncharacterized protein involved in exopolysaccharide biosynthesis
MDTPPEHSRPMMESFLEFLQTVTRYRIFISRFVLSVTVVVTIIALLLPRWYKSTASVFPAEKADLFGGLDGIASFAKALSPSKALSALGGSNEADRYLAILKSGTVLSAVIEKFDLVHVYDIGSYPMEKTAKELLSNVQFTVEPEGNLLIEVYDRDPQRAADMANFFVEMLNRTNSELAVQNARGNRQFIEARYQKNLADLRVAEDSLRAFQKRYGVIALPEQTEAAIKAAAEIMGQIALKEVQVGIASRNASEENPTVQAARIEVDELRKKLGEMNTGTPAKGNDPGLFVPFKQVPDLSVEYVRRFRDVEIQYKILQFVTPLYEQAKVEENRQTPSVLVLDRAAPAERKSKPKVSLFALIAFVASTLIAIFVVMSLELARQLQTRYPDRFAQIASAVRVDWFGLRFWRSRT